MKTKTKSGFSYDIDPEIMKKYKVVRALRDMYKGTDTEKVVATADFVGLVLGEDGLQKLSEHLDPENNNPSIDEMVRECLELIKGMGNKGKNS